MDSCCSVRVRIYMYIYIHTHLVLTQRFVGDVNHCLILSDEREMDAGMNGCFHASGHSATQSLAPFISQLFTHRPTHEISHQAPPSRKSTGRRDPPRRNKNPVGQPCKHRTSLELKIAPKCAINCYYLLPSYLHFPLGKALRRPHLMGIGEERRADILTKADSILKSRARSSRTTFESHSLSSRRSVTAKVRTLQHSLTTERCR